VEGNADRVARNESTFREANERIHRTAHEYWHDGLVPFICECADRGCKQIIQLSLEDYAEVRAHPRRFVVAPGHDADGGPAGRIVAEHSTYAVVEKTGRSGALAEERDARSRRG
jgi:hypothetical protein